MNPTATLDVYITAGCPNCAYARQLAGLAAKAFPDLCIRVLELGQVADPPEAVFATPTYLLNGKVISLGNPDQQVLFSLLHEAVSAR